jgi:hypothetical protein
MLLHLSCPGCEPLRAKLLDQDGGEWKEVDAGDGGQMILRWALFEQYVEDNSSPFSTTITARFKNWSHGADRQAQLGVEWTLPQQHTSLTIRCT